MYGLALRSAGYNVVAFPDPLTFFKALDVGLPDLLILDWNLPVNCGADVLKTLRQDARTEHLGVVVLSSVARNQGEEEFASRCGVLAWFEKPKTTPQQLVASLSALQLR